MMPQFKSQQVRFHIVSTEVRSVGTEWNVYLKRRGKGDTMHKVNFKIKWKIHGLINQTKSINYTMFDYETHYPMIFKL